MMVLGMFVFVILCISLCRWTVSKALLMSSATAMVLCGGWFMLKPFVMMLLMLCSAVVVECFVRNPCWCCGDVILAITYGCIIFSSVLAMGDRREIGL